MTNRGGPGNSDDDRDDRQLMAAHVAGDPTAFATLFSRHRDRLWAVALRTTGDAEEAADALQDALMAAFKRADSYRGDAAVTTWLHRVVVNSALDRMRRRRTRPTEPLPDDLEEHAGRGSLSTQASGTEDPAEAALRGERQQEVLRALGTLAPDQRAALVLVDMEGHSVDEAAAILGVPAGTVKSRCSRGRARLVPLLAATWASDRAPDPALDPSPDPALGPGGNRESSQSVPSVVDPDSGGGERR